MFSLGYKYHNHLGKHFKIEVLLVLPILVLSDHSKSEVISIPRMVEQVTYHLLQNVRVQHGEL